MSARAWAGGDRREILCISGNPRIRHRPLPGARLLGRPAALGILLVVLALCAPGVAAAKTDHTHFGFANVAAKAKKLAAQSWHKPASVPAFLGKLDYSHYQQIRLKPDAWLWRKQHSRFQIGPISPGYLYTHTVKLSVVAPSGVHAVDYNKSDFSYPSVGLKHKIPADLGFAGFQVSYRFADKTNSRHSFLVFLGASYFRGIADGEVYGSSARGVAIDTAVPAGEQFPRFTHYWFVRPAPDARSLTFYALLQGQSVTGAYRFVIWPGKPTRMEVKARLFMRQSVKLLGVAPLTSMFLYGANTPRPAGNWRPQVHDSNGLLIHNGTGEWLWRPLRNPTHLKTYYFSSDNPWGFGLLQRDTDFSHYESLSARYDKRPSLWVQPDGQWGKGHVVLVEIPSKSHNNDNMVAFWSPKTQPQGGKALTFRYTLTFGDPSVPLEPMGHVATTLVGRAHADAGGKTPKNAYHINVDFGGGPLAKLSPSAHVNSVVSAEDGGKVIEHYVQYIPPLHQWRLDIVAQPPASGKALRLRAYLKQGQQTLTETWSYALPADNGIGQAGK